MDQRTVAALVVKERKARDAMERAVLARARAADDRALATAELAEGIGPTAAARALGVTLTVVQRARDRARAVRAERTTAGEATS